MVACEWTLILRYFDVENGLLKGFPIFFLFFLYNGASKGFLVDSLEAILLLALLPRSATSGQH